MKVILSPRSLADLIDISDYIAEDSLVRALSFTDEIEGRCRKLGDMPGSGQLFELGSQFRRVPYGSYNIYYAVTDHVRIVRILHSARHVDENDLD